MQCENIYTTAIALTQFGMRFSTAVRLKTYIKQIEIIFLKQFRNKFKLIANRILFEIKYNVGNYASNFLWGKTIRVIWTASRLLAEGKPWNEMERKGNVVFNDALNTFYLRLYGVGHMVKDHSDSERRKPLPPHGLLFPINSKGSFIYTIPQTG